MMKLLYLFLILNLVFVRSSIFDTFDKDEEGSESSGLTGNELAEAQARVDAADPDETRAVPSRGFEDISARFCGPNESGTCDYLGYIESVLLNPLVAWLFVILTLPFCCCFWCLRLCGVCGGCKRSFGFCCAGAPRVTIADAYDKREVWATRIGIGIVVALLFIAFLIVQVYNSQLSNETEDYIDAIIDRAQGLVDTGNRVKDTVFDLNDNPPPELSNVEALSDETKQDIEDGIQQAQDILDMAKDITDDVKSYNSDRQLFLQLFMVCSVILALIALVGACGSFPKLALILGICGFFVLWLAFILYVVHASIALVTEDLCLALDRAVVSAGNSNGPSSTVVEEALEPVAEILRGDCSEYIDFNSTRGHLEDVLDDSVVETCDYYMNDICPFQFFPCSPLQDCSAALCPTEPCTADNIDTYYSLPIRDPLYGCVDGTGTGTTPCPQDPTMCPGGTTPGVCQFITIANATQCKEQCNDPALKAQVLDSAAGLDYILKFRDLWKNDLSGLLSCQLPEELVVETHNYICTDLAGSVAGVAAGMLMTAILYIFGIVFGVLGSKRFTNSFEKRSKELMRSATTMLLNFGQPRKKQRTMNTTDGTKDSSYGGSKRASRSSMRPSRAAHSHRGTEDSAAAVELDTYK